jgi:hypothetical protein
VIRWPYAVIGTVLGVLWIVQRDVPVWEHLIRTGVILLVIPPVAHLVRDRVLHAKGQVAHAQLSLPRIVASKLSLIGTAFTLDWLIGVWTGPALAVDIALGAGITLAIALGGSALHPRFVVPRPSRALATPE